MKVAHKFLYESKYSKSEVIDEIKVGTLSIVSEKINPNKRYNCLLIESGQEDYAKKVLEATFNTLTELTQSVSLNRSGSKGSFDKNITDQGLKLQIAESLRAMSMFFGYFINSSSWHDQEIHDFDKHTFIQRLDNIKNILTR